MKFSKIKELKYSYEDEGGSGGGGGKRKRVRGWRGRGNVRYEMIDILIRWEESFHNVYVHQIIMMYTLNILYF